ncbi:MAG: hypothetical protein PHY43_11310 [Verrucomicrobiales bacterium]|nr:hypothetical protein [Verrucomicrobiales bacterium]
MRPKTCQTRTPPADRQHVLDGVLQIAKCGYLRRYLKVKVTDDRVAFRQTGGIINLSLAGFKFTLPTLPDFPTPARFPEQPDISSMQPDSACISLPVLYSFSSPLIPF